MRAAKISFIIELVESSAPGALERLLPVKDFVVWLGLGLLASCALASIYVWLGLTTEPAPVTYEVGIKGISSSSMGIDKQDFSYPQVNVVDGARSTGFGTDVNNNSIQGNAQYPVNGVW